VLRGAGRDEKLSRDFARIIFFEQAPCLCRFRLVRQENLEANFKKIMKEEDASGENFTKRCSNG
jgi:hypothetical protein